MLPEANSQEQLQVEFIQVIVISLVVGADVPFTAWFRTRGPGRRGRSKGHEKIASFKKSADSVIELERKVRANLIDLTAGDK